MNNFYLFILVRFSVVGPPMFTFLLIEEGNHSFNMKEFPWLETWESERPNYNTYTNPR